MSRVYEEVRGRKKYIPLSKKVVLWMLYICQYQQIIIHGAANKEECAILVVRNIQLVYMVVKIVRKAKMQMVATSRRVIALWHVQQLS